MSAPPSDGAFNTICSIQLFIVVVVTRAHDAQSEGGQQNNSHFWPPQHFQAASSSATSAACRLLERGGRGEREQSQKSVQNAIHVQGDFDDTDSEQAAATAASARTSATPPPSPPTAAASVALSAVAVQAHGRGAYREGHLARQRTTTASSTVDVSRRQPQGTAGNTRR